MRALAAGLALLCGIVVLNAEEDRSAAELRQALESKNEGERGRAAQALGRMGVAAKPALGRLRALLRDDSATVRVHAAAAVSKIDRSFLKDSLPVLLAARRADDDRVRSAAADALKEIGPGVRTASPWLLELLKRTDAPPAPAEQKAVQTLAPFGLEAVPALVDALETGFEPPPNPDPRRGDLDYRLSEQARSVAQGRIRLRNVLAQVLSKGGAPAVPTLIELLNESDATLRYAAADALARLGSEAREALEPLARRLADRDAGVRLRAAEAIAQLGQHTPAAVDLLIQTLDHKDAALRRTAAAGLNPLLLRPHAEKALPALTGALDDPESPVRVKAAELLCELVPPGEPGKPARQRAAAVLVDELRVADQGRSLSAQALDHLAGRLPEAVPGLQALLKDRDVLLRLQAARLLARIGPAEAKGALPAVRAALQDKHATVRREALACLASPEFGKAEADPTGLLREALADEEPLVRVKAAELLLQRGGVKESLPVLLDAVGMRDERRGNSPAAHEAMQVLSRARPAGEEAVPVLVQALRHDNPAVRQYALSLLSRIGPIAREAAPALLPLLKDKDSSVRSFARSAVMRIDALDKEAAPAVIELLKAKEPEVRQAALYLLQRMGPAAKEAAPAVVEFLKDKQPQVRSQAANVLGQIGGDPKVVVPVLTDLLKEPDEQVVRSAVFALGRFGADAVTPLTEALDGKQPSVQATIVQMLGQKGSAAKSAAAKLAALLAEPDENLHRTVALALQQIGPDALPALVKAADHAEPRVRGATIEAIGRFGPRARDSLPMLTESLKDSDLGVRVRAAGAVWNVTRQSEGALPILIEGLKDKETATRRAAARTLQQLELKRGEAGTAALLEALKDEDRPVRFTAACALTRCLSPGSEQRLADQMLPVILESLRDADFQVRQRATQALIQLGPWAKPAIPTLIEAMRDERLGGTIANDAVLVLGGMGLDALEPLAQALQGSEPRARMNIARALGTIGPESVPILLKMLKDADPQVRSTAAGALMTWTHHEAVVPSLIQVLRESKGEQDQSLRYSVIFVLGSAGSEAEAAISVLIDLLKEGGPQLFQPTAAALGNFGPPAKAAVPILTDALKGQDAHTRLHAAGALARIDPESGVGVKVLIEALEGADPGIAGQALQQLGLAGPAARSAVPGLVKVLESEERNTRASAAFALARIGPEAKAAVPALLAALQKEEVGNRHAYVQALSLIGAGKPAVPVLVDVLLKDTGYARLQAADMLGRLGADAEEAVPQLAPLLKDPDANLRLFAATALIKIDPKQRAEALPVLVEALSAPYVPVEVIRFLGVQGEAAKEALPFLIEKRRDRHPPIRIAAAAALCRIDRNEVSASLPVLLEGLDAWQYGPAVHEAAETLGELLSKGGKEFGPEAQAAIPKLKRLLKHRNPDTRAAAAQALERISPGAK